MLVFPFARLFWTALSLNLKRGHRKSEREKEKNRCPGTNIISSFSFPLSVPAVELFSRHNNFIVQWRHFYFFIILITCSLIRIAIMTSISCINAAKHVFLRRKIFNAACMLDINVSYVMGTLSKWSAQKSVANVGL